MKNFTKHFEIVHGDGDWTVNLSTFNDGGSGCDNIPSLHVSGSAQGASFHFSNTAEMRALALALLFQADEVDKCDD